MYLLILIIETVIILNLLASKCVLNTCCVTEEKHHKILQRKCVHHLRWHMNCFTAIITMYMHHYFLTLKGTLSLPLQCCITPVSLLCALASQDI
jgi:hypothetical protein